MTRRHKSAQILELGTWELGVIKYHHLELSWAAERMNELLSLHLINTPINLVSHQRNDNQNP